MQAQVVVFIAQGPEDFGLGRGREPGQPGAHGISERGRQHADHLVGSAIEQDLAAHDGRVGMKAAPPQGIRQDGDAVMAAGIFTFREGPAQARPNAEHGEDIGRNPGSREQLRLSHSGEVHRAGPDDADSFQRGGLLAPFEENAQVNRECGV